MANETTDLTFKQDVIDSEIPVLVDFWAPWCGPCRMVGPIIEGIAEKAKGKAKVYKVNVDDNPIVAHQYGIASIPTVMVFRQGSVDKTYIGVQQEKVYLQALGFER